MRCLTKQRIINDLIALRSILLEKSGLLELRTRSKN